MLHLFDQQVGLHLHDVIENVLLQVIGPGHLCRHHQPPVTHIFRLFLEPVAMVLQVIRARLFPVAFFEQCQEFPGRHQGTDMQARSAGLGQGCGMVHDLGVTQGRVDDQQ